MHDLKQPQTQRSMSKIPQALSLEVSLTPRPAGDDNVGEKKCGRKKAEVSSVSSAAARKEETALTGRVLVRKMYNKQPKSRVRFLKSLTQTEICRE